MIRNISIDPKCPIKIPKKIPSKKNTPNTPKNTPSNNHNLTIRVSYGDGYITSLTKITILTITILITTIITIFEPLMIISKPG